MSRSARMAVILVCCAVPAVGIARGQAPDPAAMAKEYGDSAQKNATLMKQYAWKMRVEVTIKGETKPAEIYQMRYDLDGQLQKTPLTAPEEVKKKRGIRGAIQKSKIEDFKEWTGELAELVKKYMAPTPGTMLDFYGKATISPGADGTARMSARDFIQKGDQATYWINKETKVAARYSFSTTLQGDAVEGQVEFKQIPNGPAYAARVKVSVPAKDVAAKFENFDYAKQ